MKIGLRHVSAAAIVWLRSALAAGGQTRASLARELCRRENWRNPKGDLCLASARVALPRIASELDLALPPSRGAPRRRPAPRDYPDLAVACSLGDLGEVEVTPQAAGEAPLARAMLATWHPEGEARTPGARVSYWIHSPRLGRLGLLVFSAAGWHQKARDTFIGWSQSARDAHLDKLVVNDRFLLLPSVRVAGLASHVLALAVRRLPGDWQAKYGVRPLLAYTYVAPEHAGTSYLAAGWQCCPQRTSGRTGVRRSVWMKPLADDWRDVLCREPEVRPGTRPAPAGDADWAEREYGRGRFSDVRVGKRVVMMGRAWNDRPGAPLPVIFPGEAEQKAAYRLLSNPRVKMDGIVAAHKEAVVERCRGEALVLAIQDTSFLDYGGLDATEGLIDIGGGGSGALGLGAHAGVAFSAGGRPLGLFHFDADFRAGEASLRTGVESARWLDGYDAAVALKGACAATRVVMMCDREGDFRDLLARGAGGDVGLLVRSNRSHRRRVLCGAARENLWEHMAGRDVVATKSIDIDACGGPRRRRARKGVALDIRAARVALLPPGDRKGSSPLSMLAVRVTERHPPQGREPLDWLLVCSEGEATAEAALEIVSLYERRWWIEEYFKALKAGTRIKDRRLDQADDLRKCLAFDAITACLVMDIERTAREHPDTPAREVVPGDVIKVLRMHMTVDKRYRSRSPPEPSIADFAVDTARLAGFTPKKRQPLPGTGKLWQGYLILLNFVENYRIMMQMERE